MLLFSWHQGKFLRCTVSRYWTALKWYYGVSNSLRQIAQHRHSQESWVDSCSSRLSSNEGVHSASPPADRQVGMTSVWQTIKFTWWKDTARQHETHAKVFLLLHLLTQTLYVHQCQRPSNSLGRKMRLQPMWKAQAKVFLPLHSLRHWMYNISATDHQIHLMKSYGYSQCKTQAKVFLLHSLRKTL